MLGQHEERTGRVVVVVLEKVMNEVWRKRDQVDDEQPRRQCADRLALPRPPTISPPVAHGAPTLSD